MLRQYQKTRILFIDDEPYFRAPIADFLRSCGYSVTEAETASEARALQQQNPFPVILTDLMLPGFSGLEFLRWLHHNYRESTVIVISGTGDINEVVECVQNGAYDFIRKPVDNLARIDMIVRRALEQRRVEEKNRELMDRLRNQNINLEKIVSERTEAIQIAYDKLAKKNKKLQVRNDEMEDIYLHIIAFISDTLEHKDGYTAGHSERVKQISLLLACNMNLDREMQHTIARAAKLHDIGKLVIDLAFINKPGPLTDRELMQFRKHPATGASLLKELSFLKDEADLILHHHERHDGKGYPAGKAGENIPLGARIISLADALDAMLSDRSYKKALSLDAAIEEVQANSGTQFHPEVAATFQRIMITDRKSFTALLAPAAPPVPLPE